MEKLSDVAVFQEEAAEILGVSVRTMEAWRQCNEGPTYIHIGRRVRYRISDLEAYVAEKTVVPQGVFASAKSVMS